MTQRLLFQTAAIALTYMFWRSGFAKLWDFQATLGEMAHFGLNPPWLFALGTIALQLGGSALVIFGGRFAWLGALPLAGFTLATIPLAHGFESLIGQEHISVIGGLLVAALLGWQRGPQWRLRGATS